MNALKNIIKCLPDRAVVPGPGQGMLFSPTIAPHIEKFAYRLMLAPGYKLSGRGKHGRACPAAVHTFADVVPSLVAALRAECTITGTAQFKATVSALTAGLADSDWYTALLAAPPMPLPLVTVLHSTVSQIRRTVVTSTFRDAKAGVLVATSSRTGWTIPT